MHKYEKKTCSKRFTKFEKNSCLQKMFTLLRWTFSESLQNNLVSNNAVEPRDKPRCKGGGEEAGATPNSSADGPAMENNKLVYLLARSLGHAPWYIIN